MTQKTLKFIHCIIENKYLKNNWKPKPTRSEAQSEAKDSCFFHKLNKEYKKGKTKTNQNPVRKRESVPHIYFQSSSFLEEKLIYIFRMSKATQKAPSLGG
jgi:hypothetical protein